MIDNTPKSPDQDEAVKPATTPQAQPDQDSQELEDAQADAAEQREEEGGYQ